jgi:hypothetical protein
LLSWSLMTSWFTLRMRRSMRSIWGLCCRSWESISCMPSLASVISGW